MMYTYDKLIVVQYWNTYRVYYDHGKGKKELLTWKMNKEDAIKAGKMQVDYMNRR